MLTAPDFLVSLVNKHIPTPSETEESALASHSPNRAGKVLALTRKAGFQPVTKYWEGHDVFIEDAERFWDIQRTFSSIVRKRLLSAPQEKVDAVRRDFFESCRKVRDQGGEMVYPYAAFYVIGRRPD